MKATITIPRCTNIGRAIQEHFTTHTLIGEVDYNRVEIIRDTLNKVNIAKVEYSLTKTHKRK